jgi:uncharacterized protein (DUF58 family)
MIAALQSLRIRIRTYVDTELFRLRGPEQGTLVLVQRRIFILPTRYGLLFMLTLLLMLTGSINYTLSLGFVLTFLLGALGVLSILHTFRNLARLRLTAGKVEPVFAGGTAHFTFWVENPGALDRYAIRFARGKAEPAWCDVPARTRVAVQVAVPAERRGLLRPGRVTASTRYPLGLCYAWSYIDLDVAGIVYPHPEPAGAALPPLTPVRGDGADAGDGREDFAGLRAYHPGDSPRHVAWKAAARDQGLLTKVFTGRANAELWLEWDRLPGTLGTEARLSRLARWVLEAHTAGLAFGLRLPGITLAPMAGTAQRWRALEALALFQVER